MKTIEIIGYKRANLGKSESKKNKRRRQCAMRCIWWKKSNTFSFTNDII